MAATARTKADCKEFFDDQKTLQTKIKRLADLIRNSKHFCAFTGAGISTAAGIADFRSGINTVLDTGTGKWAAMSAKKQGKSKQIKKNKRSTTSIKAVPTASHMALVALATTGPQYLKCMISQNTDGLHRRSGMPVDMLCELHGNTTLEVCDVCGRGYMRDYRCRNSLRKQKVHDHKTGRYCTVPKCGGKLHDTIINFNEDLNESVLEKAQENTDQCDVMLALGSSLTVTPAAGINATVFNGVQLSANGKPIERVSKRRNVKMLSGDEHRFEVTRRRIFADDTKEDDSAAEPSGLVAELAFFGNYSETNLSVPLGPFLKQAIADGSNGNTFEFLCRLVMDIETKQWTVEMLSDNADLTTIENSVENATKSLEDMNLLDDDAAANDKK